MKYGIIDVVKDILKGETISTTADVAQSRIDICNQCDAQNKTLKVCTACGCFLPAKVKVANASCPMELW